MRDGVHGRCNICRVTKPERMTEFMSGNLLNIATITKIAGCERIKRDISSNRTHKSHAIDYTSFSWIPAETTERQNTLTAAARPSAVAVIENNCIKRLRRL